jgi:hypothetical protein
MNQLQTLFLRSINHCFSRKLSVSLSLLSLAVATGCKPSKPASGQAFIVLKSGDVQPLADMTVAFLPESFQSDFLSLQTKFRKETASSLSALLAENAPVKKSLDAKDANIGNLESKILAAGKPDPKQEEDIAKKVEAQIVTDEKRFAAQLTKANQTLEKSKAELDNLKSAAQSLFDKRLKDQGKELDTEKNYLSKFEELIREFDSAVAEASRRSEKQEEFNEKATRRIAEIPSLVAKTLNSAIRDQRLQTPLLDEGSYKIRIDYEKIDPARNAARYLQPNKKLGEYGYYDYLAIPSELDSARTLPNARVLVKEYLSLEEQLSTGKENLREMLEQREKAATPWINLNTDKVYQLRRDSSLPSFAAPERVRSIFGSDLSAKWPPHPYKSAKDARDRIQVRIKNQEDAQAKQTLSNFAAELTRQAEANIGAVQTEIRTLTGNIAAVGASKAGRIQTENAAVTAITQKTISKLEGELEIAKADRAKFVAEIDAESQRNLRSNYLLSARLLIKSSVQSSVQTDRIGDFQIPRSAEFVWASKSRDNGEQFYWLRRVKEDAKNSMLLSNSTISGTADLEWLVDFTL